MIPTPRVFLNINQALINMLETNNKILFAYREQKESKGTSNSASILSFQSVKLEVEAKELLEYIQKLGNSKDGPQ